MKRAFNFRKSFSGLLHEATRVALPLLVFLLVLGDLRMAAFAAVLIFKWRVLAVKSRFWKDNIRANMVDVFVGLSVVEFMSLSSLADQIIWLVAYIVWVVYLKRLSTQNGMILQGIIAHTVAMSAIMLSFSTLEYGVVLFLAWFVAYFSSRHALSAYKEDHAPVLAHVWALFVMQLTWVLWHWQVEYWFISQLVLITTTIFTGLSISYALSKKETVNTVAVKQILLSTTLMSVAIIVLHRWKDTSFLGG